MAISCCSLLCQNTTIEEDDGTLSCYRLFLLFKHIHRKESNDALSSFFFLYNNTTKKRTIHWHILLLKHKENKTHKKTTKKNKRREGASFQAPALPFHFQLLPMPSCFGPFVQALSPNYHLCLPISNSQFYLSALSFCEL